MTVRHAWPIVIVRTFLLGAIFVIGCLSIMMNQIVGMFVFANDGVQKQAVINATKKQFIAVFGTVTRWANPCKISITYDPSTLPEGDSFKVDSLGNLSSILTPNSVVISNHQIYTDWLYLWFILYTARLGDSVYIMLKDLSKIPVLGFGMKNYNFLFLSRKWEKDKIVLTNQLLTIDANARGLGPANGVTHVTSTNVGSSELHHWPEGHKSGQIWPYLVILYPEGTVTSARTRAKSDKFCQERNMPVLRHTLLPRVRGLFLTLRKLRNTVEIVYDFTCGYSGLKPGEYGEDIYTLKSHYLKGYGPEKISYHLRGWKLSEIPLGEETEDIDDVSPEDLVKFEEWLFKVWYEKDRMLDQFYKHGSFVDPKSDVIYTPGKVAENTVVADFRINGISDIIGSFASITIILLLLRIIWILILKLL
ncbi:uncharacterized protein AC631_00929 [Debaryomyces fabryi]|uniref:Phospholipid/glycerol acyltransferase domain-containing protein n=1 Tax=Debaryomyces fabryi TaxID=58627 RepID=A0A0V1Q432_9ASCO|nr:uncharacterized protein AC631_00929 [Debaryomyces fabryi]KSA03291.1 hypothetical protein AC631_00929 [Debaryomyces fabryi]CUM45114.1 unnamed protein product [Debaryomyces fabryi]